MDKKNKIINNKKKNLLFLFIIIFVIGNISFYLKERAKWMYDGQPYPRAKEWLIPANMMLVYGTTLTKLPFIDERSFIMKPIIGLQDYFVSKWQENLPDDDAEKHLGWYIFRLRTYIVPNAGGIILYGNKNYSFDEVIEFNEKAWKTIKTTVEFQAKDKDFNEIRYAAFNNLSVLFVSNFTAYWIHNQFEKGFVDDISTKRKEISRYQTNNSYVNSNEMFADEKKFKRLYQLYQWIDQMNKEYKNKYPKIFYKAKRAEAAEYWENSRMQEITKYILYYLVHTKRFKQKKNFCDLRSNPYLRDYIKSKKWLLDKEKFLKAKNISIKKTVLNALDGEIESACPNINIKKELNNGNI
ncbi:hypothetical protein [Hydrogenimonas sp. SS33]|uniref:hypothetical protein n=1 Tax=Hydrogenimonas leucolamina TaxID=2954236 RepID=UPI00336BD32B